MSKTTKEKLGRIVLHQMVREAIVRWLRKDVLARRLILEEIEANPDVGAKVQLKEYGLRIHITKEIK